MIDKYILDRPKKSVGFASLGQIKYLSALQYVDAVVGNSSSGLLEAPSFKIGTINIGDRQKGRVRAVNTYDCKIDQNKMIYLMKKILRNKRKKFNLQKNPYYGNNVSNKIYKILNKINFNNLNHKYFRDIKFQ